MDLVRVAGWGAAVAGLVVITVLATTFSVERKEAKKLCIHEVTETNGGTVELPPETEDD